MEAGGLGAGDRGFGDGTGHIPGRVVLRPVETQHLQVLHTVHVVAGVPPRVVFDPDRGELVGVGVYDHRHVAGAARVVDDLDTPPPVRFETPEDGTRLHRVVEGAAAVTTRRRTSTPVVGLLDGAWQLGAFRVPGLGGEGREEGEEEGCSQDEDDSCKAGAGPGSGTRRGHGHNRWSRRPWRQVSDVKNKSFLRHPPRGSRPGWRSADNDWCRPGSGDPSSYEHED